MNEILNIIHLEDYDNFPHRRIRKESFLKQIEEQRIKEYKIWEGIYIEDNPIKAISQSHKKIVLDAKEKGLERVIIAEDDFLFTSKNSWSFFINSIPKDGYDIFLSHLYHGEWNENGKVLGTFAALTLYSVHQRFYDIFLNKPEDEHLDLVMNKAWRHEIKVCLPMVCKQMSGYSDNEKKEMDWEFKEINKPFLK